MIATRKLAAILVADMVGYSRLMSNDEVGTARAVTDRREAAQPIVVDFGGRMVKTTGDGFLLEFPSIVAAVECAIAIQKVMTARNAETPEQEHILYRIGVNLGDVLIDGDDILGEGVNIAARLESICDPGGIFVSAPHLITCAAGLTRPLSRSARDSSRTSLGPCGSIRSSSTSYLHRPSPRPPFSTRKVLRASPSRFSPWRTSPANAEQQILSTV